MYLVNTNKKDFKLFKKTCKKYLKKLSLKNWDVVYDWVDIPGNSAECRLTLSGMQATMGLSKELRLVNKKEKTVKKAVTETAKHEVFEVFLGRLSTIASARYVTPSEVEEATHEVVQVLGKVIK